MDPNETPDLQPEDENPTDPDKPVPPPQHGGSTLNAVDDAFLLMNGTNIAADGISLAAQGAAEVVSG